MRIGIFDSGVGGLAVLGYARELLPNEEFIFYADVDHVPYGIKTNDEIISYSDNIISFFEKEKCDICVIACNTATSVAAEYLRGKYSLPILGIEPAVKPAVEMSNNKRVLVIATKVTAREKKLHNLVTRFDLNHLVDILETQKLVDFAEKGDFDSEAVYEYLCNAFSKINVNDYSIVVAGCTHFIHFKKIIKRIFENDIEIIDGANGTAKNLYNTVNKLGLCSENKGNTRFYQSGRLVEDGETLNFYEKIIKHAMEQ